MRRDRDGSELEELDDEQHVEHTCDGGWLGYDRDGRPFPCLECRPHLRRTGSARPRWAVRRPA